jgi:5,10-methenyltetrahydrofolate synthetase
MHELDPSFTGIPANNQQQTDVARWRKSERARLIKDRLALSIEDRKLNAVKIAQHLDTIVPANPETVVSVYWPFRGEPDLRPWMHAVHDSGRQVVLPVVIKKEHPLIFRKWQPGAPMKRGIWNIPVPAEDAEILPTVTIAPLVGFDKACFRLGNGGGYYDRTLATLKPGPLVIGVGYAIGEITTIYPQPYDIPMDWIVTEQDEPRECTDGGS